MIAAPDSCDAVQANVEPETVELNKIEVEFPLQILSPEAAATGEGFTVTSTVNVLPTHPLGALGVTVYLTTPGILVEVFVRV
ncbi:MAG: hypothetical protein JPMHGGIA_02816 [Saprospiraceae bacterium]|nr:hypothetical protein [Saprospiraceae bacterium]